MSNRSGKTLGVIFVGVVIAGIGTITSITVLTNYFHEGVHGQVRMIRPSEHVLGGTMKWIPVSEALAFPAFQLIAGSVLLYLAIRWREDE